MATKKSDSKKKGDKEKDPEKEAKRKARQEALKNRPAEQRPNSKQIDVIAINDKSKVMNFGYAVKYQLQFHSFQELLQLSLRKDMALFVLRKTKRLRKKKRKNQKIKL